MKLTLSQLVNCQAALNSVVEKQLPIRVAYKLGKIAKTIHSELMNLEDVRSKLIRQLGETMEGQEGKWRVTPGNEPKFHEEMNKILSEEVELDIDPIPVDDLSDLKFTPIEISNIDFLLVMD